MLSKDIINVHTQAYLRGPPPMVAAARRRLTDYGGGSASIFAEEFLPSGDSTPG